MKHDALHQFFMAPEKILADHLLSHRNLISNDDIYSFVCEGLRIDKEAIKELQYPLYRLLLRKAL